MNLRKNCFWPPAPRRAAALFGPGARRRRRSKLTGAPPTQWRRRTALIRRFISCSVFASIIYAFICWRIDYCNSLFAGFWRHARPPAFQSVMNSTAVSPLTCNFHFYTYMTNVLTLTSSCLSYPILLVTRTQHGPKFLCDLSALTSVWCLLPLGLSDLIS